MNVPHWFYIKHVSTQKVISIYDNDESDYIRSQVIVKKPEYIDSELWCWDDNYLRNKKTGLVLDIRKGKLRLIEDTEICLYHKKPIESAENQLWAVRTNISLLNATHPLSQQTEKTVLSSFVGSVIYSICNSDWVLDISHEDETKLILFPYHPDDSDCCKRQRWDFVPENDMSLTNEPHLYFSGQSMLISSDPSLQTVEEYYYYSRSSSFSSSSTFDNVIGFAYGLTPARRSSSQSSLTSRKGSQANEPFKDLQHFTATLH
ncbi:MAG: hypothetical protein EXX96DRAFT_512305 [Benjaminiella poitrasii]|nr:MAG: hypothetical protein EXX96DRAFT_512305 [Benjaminiella poitrasii]